MQGLNLVDEHPVVVEALARRLHVLHRERQERHRVAADRHKRDPERLGLLKADVGKLAVVVRELFVRWQQQVRVVLLYFA